MFKSIVDSAEKLRSNLSVRAVVIRGSGSAFCAGLDVKSGKKHTNIFLAGLSCVFFPVFFFLSQCVIIHLN
jgi:enoyl-CoA hydratase/carnithine racemase